MHMKGRIDVSTQRRPKWSVACCTCVKEFVLLLMMILYNIIGASLSEPHIDHDNVPRRGECLYVSMYVSGCV